MVNLFLTVRLVNGTAPYNGRAEIFYNGEWGTICHDYWENPETNVFCRQLGFEGAITGLRSAAFGKGSGMIWMDDINCTGQETAISQCVHRGWRVTDCKHNQDASVICIPKGEMIIKKNHVILLLQTLMAIGRTLTPCALSLMDKIL